MLYLTIEIPIGSLSSFSSLSVNCNVYLDLVYPSTSVTFRHRDGLPIKISTKVIAKLEARCRHGTDNILEVAIKPNRIEWIIEGERKSSGAFKVGHSVNAEYHSRDFGESVIYHPPLELTTTTPKRIEMKVKVTYATGNLEIGICIDLQLQRGLGKGISSMAVITLRPTNPANMLLPIENRTCTICKPELVFDKPDKIDNRIAIAGLVENDNCLMTSEYIKVVLRAAENRQMWLTSSMRKQVPLGGLSTDQHFKWHCSAGKFVGSNTGRSVIYRTPNESELSKSPVDIAVEEEDGRTVASRRFWLLKGSSVMHC